jgi:hypothetical protein
VSPCATEPLLPPKDFAPQRFSVFRKASVVAFRAALARLTARFSFRDLPDFFVILCRGDLSDIIGPFLIWGLVGPDSLTLRPSVWRAPIAKRRGFERDAGVSPSLNP